MNISMDIHIHGKPGEYTVSSDVSPCACPCSEGLLKDKCGVLVLVLVLVTQVLVLVLVLVTKVLVLVLE